MSDPTRQVNLFFTDYNIPLLLLTIQEYQSHLTSPPIFGALECSQIKSLSCGWSLRTFFSIWALKAFPPFFKKKLLLLIEGQKKRRNTLHEFKKSAKTTLIKEDPLLKIKTKKMNTADQCANRCIRNKGLPFTCK